MNKHTKFSARASLAAPSVRMRQSGIWQVIDQHVQIEQKVIKYNPLNKLLDAFNNILAGGQGLVEVNTRVRLDDGIQRAFGRDDCADQSMISETLNHCTVEQIQPALQTIYQTQSQSYQHDYDTGYQVLDMDMTGMLAGRQGEGVTKGYFAGQKNRRGRQLGRVVATLYDEIVVDRLYDGQRQLDRNMHTDQLMLEFTNHGLIEIKPGHEISCDQEQIVGHGAEPSRRGVRFGTPEKSTLAPNCGFSQKGMDCPRQFHILVEDTYPVHQALAILNDAGCILA